MKKSVTDIEKQRELFISKLAEQGTTEQRQIDYLWSTIIAPSLGYGSDRLGPYTPNPFAAGVREENKK